MQVFNSLKEDFAFGQYRFQSLEYVLAKDHGYVKWLRETGKIEVNCLYIGASQAELDHCKTFNTQKYTKDLALNRPSKHVSRSKKYVEACNKPSLHVSSTKPQATVYKCVAPDHSFMFTLNYDNSLYLNCPYEDEYTDYEFSRYD